MERLTKRLPSGAADYNYPKICYIGDGSGADRISKSAFRQRCVEQLADYEDTKLTPEEIDMDHEAAEHLRQLCRGYDLGRLEELAEADKDGRVVVRCANCKHRMLDVIYGPVCNHSYGLRKIFHDSYCPYGEYQTNAGGGADG